MKFKVLKKTTWSDAKGEYFMVRPGVYATTDKTEIKLLKGAENVIELRGKEQPKVSKSTKKD